MRRVGGVSLVDSLRVGEFRALWSAEAVSILGDQLARVALAIVVFDRTSSAALTALTYALTFVPAVVGGLLLSGLADRFPRKRVLVLTDLARAALAAAMAIPGLSLWILWALVGLLTMASAPFKAAQLALLPDVLGADRYQPGLALRQMTVQIAQVAGFGFGGILVGVLSSSGALLVDALTFGFSALIIAVGVRPVRAVKERTPTEVTNDVQRSGLDLRLMAPFVLGALIGLFVVPEGLAAPYAEVLGAGTLAIGLLMAADPVGSVIGAWWAAKSSTSATPTRRAVVVPAALAGLPLIGCAFVPGIGWSIVLWAASGVFSTIYLIRLQPMIVSVVPDSRRGAVMGRFSTTVYAGQGVAILSGGIVAELIGPAYTVAAAGVLATALVVIVGAAWKLARPRRARITEDEPAQADQAAQRPSDFLVTHSGLLPGRPAEGGDTDQEAATSETGPSSEGNGSAVSMPGKSQSAHGGSPNGRVGWSVWSHSLYARGFVLFIEMAAIAAVGISAALDPPSWIDVRVSAFVVAFGLIAAELARRVERRRRRFSDTPHVNFSSVWTLAGALILPPALAAVLAVVLYVHLWLRCSRGVAGTFASRFLFNASNVILSCQVAGWLAQRMHLVPMTHAFDASDALACAAVVVVYFTVNSAIAAITIAIVRSDRTAKRLLGPFSENALELATLCMGVVTALLISMHPTLVVLIFVPLYALHRSVLIRQFEHAATIDAKTGLLNSTAWHALAEAEFARARRSGARIGILMIDLDHFRRINNSFGHLAGDRALRAVGQVLRDVVGGEDYGGRFGGEEFVVVLPDVTPDELEAAANRTCEAIFRVRVEGIHDQAAGEQHPLSASVGAAAFPDAGTSLEDVLLAADLALFAAKDGGRNQVRMMKSTT